MLPAHGVHGLRFSYEHNLQARPKGKDMFLIISTLENLTYLLCRCVFDSLGVVVVVDDVKIFDGG